MRGPIKTLIALALVSGFPLAASGQTGLTDQAAPKWDIKQWIQLPAGQQALHVGDLKGKVIHIFAFQAW